MREHASRLVVTASLAVAVAGCAPAAMTSRDLLAVPQPTADPTIAYGPAPNLGSPDSRRA